MAYIARNAANTLFGYLDIEPNGISYIADTNKRGFIYHTESGEDCVIFICPISHKANNSKNFFDTRDSGARERGVAWEYALLHDMKYFCVAVNDQVEKYNQYIFSLECNEKRIAEVAGTVNGVRSGSGTQVVIPNDYIPSKNFDRILTRNNFYIAVIKKEYLAGYLDRCDNRPYMVKEKPEETEIDFEKILEQLMNLENQDFILACLELMKTHQLLTDNNLSILSNKDKCASMFRHNNFRGILFAVASEQDEAEQRKDTIGNTRYYADKYDIDGRKYFVSSEWRPDREDARKPLIDWIFSQLKNVKYRTGYVSEFSRNRIIFGAPGTGKSYTVNSEKDILLEDGGEYERVTFHPDYSYANFAGTYKPVACKDSDGKEVITYAYVPGPFMRMYVKALQNSKTANPTPFLLIIEEINRANVAAVFGDVFQLLDRDDAQVSEYPIRSSEDIRKYLAMELKCDEIDLAEIKIPDNMFIWATMNSADQGVFPMDTAFKRRWDFTYLGINHSEDKIKGKTVTLGRGGNAREIEWNELRKAINDELSSYKVNEDKLLGPYFLSKKIVPENEEINQERFIDAFASKVIMYLFDDAAKQKRSSLFAGCKDAAANALKYSSICEEFKEKGVFIFAKEISAKFPGETALTAEVDGE